MSALALHIGTNAGDIIALVIDSIQSPHTKRAYRDALLEFFSWCRDQPASGFNRALVQRYRCALEERHLSPSTIKVRLAAIRRLASEMADQGLLEPVSASGIAKIKGPVRRGVRSGNWLTLQQVEQLLALPDKNTIIGKRDLVLLGLLIGAGLRRVEAANLTFDHVQQRDGRWVLADLIGKHNRIRTVPIPGWCKVSVDMWAQTVQLKEGRVLRPLNRAGQIIGSALTVEAIFKIVRNYGSKMNFVLAPHDLRRTFAKLAHRGRAGLEQIQLSLGHESIVTTERYIGVRQDLIDAPCDHLGVRCDQ